MYKCICKAITEEEIKNLEEKGLSKVEIYNKLMVGKDCGTCIRGERNEG